MKRTIEERISRRNYKRPNRFIWWFLRAFLIPGLAKKYHVEPIYDDEIKKQFLADKGPKFIVYNHQSRFDYISDALLAYPERMNFVIGYNEFYRKKFHVIFNLVHAVPKKNFTSDLLFARNIYNLIKQNATMIFSPEGMSSITGHNQPIVPKTGKFLKRYKVPVYCISQQGGFLSSPKVCNEDRIGKIVSKMTLLLSKEDLERLSEEEIQERVNEAIWTDDYEWNKKEQIQYKHKGELCKNYEDLMYRCPKCGAELEMEAHDNIIRCKKCGCGTISDDTYTMHPLTKDSIVPESPSIWVDEERKIEYQRIKSDPNYSFEENVTIGCLPKYKFLKHNKTTHECGKGKVTIDHSGFHFVGERDNKPYSFDLTYEDIHTLVVITDCTFFGLYVQGEYLDFYPERRSVGKMLLMVEEFARFHVNSWPNLKRLDWIYKD